MNKQLFLLREIHKEDDNEIRKVIALLTSDEYSVTRAQKLLTQAKRYEAVSSGSRANRIVLKAAELYLKRITA